MSIEGAGVCVACMRGLCSRIDYLAYFADIALDGQVKFARWQDTHLVLRLET
jgi:hypothetical protein